MLQCYNGGMCGRLLLTLSRDTNCATSAHFSSVHITLNIARIDFTRHSCLMVNMNWEWMGRHLVVADIDGRRNMRLPLKRAFFSWHELS